MRLNCMQEASIASSFEHLIRFILRLLDDKVTIFRPAFIFFCYLVYYQVFISLKLKVCAPTHQCNFSPQIQLECDAAVDLKGIESYIESEWVSFWRFHS